jgi:small subunit ribosomal protein S4
MGRYTGPVCRLCRREGLKLFLKATRCYTDKCPVERRGYAPGQHGRTAGRRRKASDYALQLREKQKVKRIYGVLETQFGNTFDEAFRKTGVTGELLLSALELRLDNVAYRLGFAGSRKAARQLIRHRHIQVNDRTVDIPSYRVARGDVIRVRERARQLPVVLEGMERQGQEGTVSWLEVDYKSATGRVLEVPTRADIPIAAQEQLIVELYSK